MTAALDAASVADAAFSARPARAHGAGHVHRRGPGLSRGPEHRRGHDTATDQFRERGPVCAGPDLIVPELEDARNYDAYAAIRQMTANLAKAAEYASTRAINVLELDPLTEELTAIDLAVQIYGDLDRCVDIAALNPLRQLLVRSRDQDQVRDLNLGCWITILT